MATTDPHHKVEVILAAHQVTVVVMEVAMAVTMEITTIMTVFSMLLEQQINSSKCTSFYSQTYSSNLIDGDDEEYQKSEKPTISTSATNRHQNTCFPFGGTKYD